MGAQGMFWKGGAAVAVFLLWLATGVSCENVVGGKPLDVCSSCHVNATCEEKAGGRKVCNCFYGFVGNGRTQCQDKDECQIGAQKICGEHTTCHNTYGSFFCTCLSGYAPSNNMSVFIPNDGTYCDDIDECNVQGICGEGGRCSNVKGDFNCFCQEGFRVHNGLEPFHPKRDGAFCEAIDCGKPPSIAHASLLSETGTGYGSRARFGCLDGFFRKSGEDSGLCGDEGVWEGLSLECVVSCGPAPQPPHSEVAWQSGHLAGSTVHHRCQDGYRRRAGNNASLCTPAGWWQAATLLCREIKPVMSDLEVFNERCLRWKADVYSGEKVDYLAEFVGSRDYQRTFLDKRKRLFSSSAVRPELCLNLFPGTNYTVNITATSERFSLIVSANTSIQAPPAPKLIFRDVEAPLPTLWLQRSIHTMDPISMYQVFVLPVEGSVVFDCRSPRTPSFHQRSSSDEPYVAAQVSLLEMGARLNFTVGDQRRYGGFYNAPLEIDRDYFVIVRLLTRWGTVRRYSCVIWAKVKGTSYTVQSVTLLVGGSVGMISFVIFLGYSYYWYCQKK